MNLSLIIGFVFFFLKFQLKSHSSPWFTPSCAAAVTHRNHYFHQYHRNATHENKKLFCDSLNHCKSSFLIFHLVLNRDLALRISLAKWFLVQSTILIHPKPLALTEFPPLSIRCVLQSFLRFLLSYTTTHTKNP